MRYNNKGPYTWEIEKEWNKRSIPYVYNSNEVYAFVKINVSNKIHVN